MHLNGWIGLEQQAREKHVFTLPAIEPTFAVNREPEYLIRRLALARADWRFETTPAKI